MASLVLAGLAVGAAASATARFVGAPSCGPAELAPLAPGGDCVSLVTSLAHRVGVVAGIATVLMALVAAGLARTAARIEQDRRVRAIERVSAGTRRMTVSAGAGD